MTPISADETLNLDSVAAISRDIAAELDQRLQVVGVTSSDGESGRVELLVTIRGCHRDPCVLMFNVSRAGHAAFERDLREKFRQALASHVTPK